MQILECITPFCVRLRGFVLESLQPFLETCPGHSTDAVSIDGLEEFCAWIDMRSFEMLPIRS